MPDGMFSASGMCATTSSRYLSYAANTTEASTAAAPLMSEVISSMPAAGLSEMPPVSNVMPLPTSATLFFALLPR